MATRQEEYAEVRNLLDEPKSGRPSGDAILSALLDREQWMANRLGNTGRAWTRGTETLSAVSGTDEYTLSSATFGKLLFAFRATSTGAEIPVPVTDYTNEIASQGYEFTVFPVIDRTSEWLTGEKLAFFRDSAGVGKVRIFPTPREDRNYTLVFSTGTTDRTNLAWSDVPLMPEFSKYRCLQAAAFLLPKCEWEGYSMDDNRMKRKELKESILGEIALEQPEFEQFIKNPTGETVSTVGYWYE